MRRRHIAAVAVTAAVASMITPLLATPASADPALWCQSAATIFVRQPNTNLELRANEEPEIGNPVWATNRGIGFAWNGQMRTGPGGRTYAFTPEGKIYQYVWTSSGWRNGGVGDQIATGWNGWGDPASKNRMTIDARGDFYGFPSDNALHWWRFDETSRKWTERIIDTGWGTKYDMIFANGPGGIFARTTDGKLYHYEYDAESQRFTEYARLVGGSGWGQFSDVASVGGGIFYALKADTGQLRWYRYLGEGNWATDSGKFIASGWSSDWQIEGSTDACTILNYTPTPATPQLSPNATAPVAAYQGDDNLLNYFFVNSSGRLTQGRQRHTGDLLLVDHQDLTGYEKFTGEVGVGVYGDGKLEVQANGYEDASVRSRSQTTKNTSSWSAAFDDLGGRVVSAPVIVKDRDNLLTSFAVDASGGLWYRKQLVLWGAPAQGKFGAWRSLGGSGLSADFTAVRNGDAIEVVGRYTDGSVRASKFNGTTLEASRSTGGTDVVGKPAAVVHADGKVQVVVRRADNKIYTQREPFAGWQPVGDLVATGAPAAVFTASGSLELSVRGANGLVHTTGQPNPALPFRAWQVQDFTEAGTDTTMINLRGGDILLAWRDPMGEIYAYRGSFGAMSARSASTDIVYTGGKTS
ncbi:tachylectin-related carbohydrate-binding protein [Lentzea sp. NPDC051838]|uniref:tachylectin-related carbohydrate-binding protein n=1 Tax=Lentzea sp. NPDC051838 TaxID=3154849 RepID=UPI003445A836